MTRDELLKVEAARAERKAIFDKLVSNELISAAERTAYQDRLAVLDGEIHAAVTPAAPPPPPPQVERLTMTLEEARLGAEEIRSRKDFWDPSRRDPATGKPALDPAEHARLRERLMALDARVLEG